ncbi:MAG: 30S ribosomal protein S6 [Magnetococcales bacterium]|nr:30S ribosomal protein S6 [Magnetococcales bacterium]NGZ05591.1 30S ribosomal protein S6 [Magnetococcales bacterium]
MAFYESIYIVRPDLTTEQVEQVVSRVADIITSGGGTILQHELWGRRQLAYPLKKNTKGFYIFNLVEGAGPLIANLEARLMIDEDVLKFQNIRVKKANLVPSPLAPSSERASDSSEVLLPGDEEYEVPDDEDYEDDDLDV